jgi:hypothetical protein
MLPPKARQWWEDSDWHISTGKTSKVLVGSFVTADQLEGIKFASCALLCNSGCNELSYQEEQCSIVCIYLAVKHPLSLDYTEPTVHEAFPEGSGTHSNIAGCYFTIWPPME